MTIEKTIQKRDVDTIIKDTKNKLTRAKYDLDQAINTEKNKLEKSRRQILVEAAIELENEGKIPIYSRSLV